MNELLSHLRRTLSRAVDPDRLDQIDPELVDQLCPPVLAFCHAWFRLEIDGIDRLPTGPALIVGNHDSGITFIEAIGFGAACHQARPQERWFGLAHDGIVDMPGLGALLVSVGAIRARPDLAAQALRAGHKVAVFPGGNLEAFRPWSRRDEIDFGGRTGWARLAVQAGVPVVPVVFCGGHGGFRVLSDNRRLARWLGARRLLRVDTWPLWVGLPWGLWLGPNFHIPLPVKVRVAVLDPVDTQGFTVEEPSLRELYGQVTGRMQDKLTDLAKLRDKRG